MFEIAYDLQQEVDKLIRERLGKHPPMWRAMARAYLIEHLGEGVRLEVDLPPKAPVSAEPSMEATE